MAAVYRTDFTVSTTFSTVKPNSLNSSSRGGFAEAVETDDCAVQSDVFVPAVGVSGFYGNARQTFGQDCGFIGGVLAVEYVGGRHGNDAYGDVLRGEGFLRFQSQLDFGTGGNDDGLGRCLGIR